MVPRAGILAMSGEYNHAINSSSFSNRSLSEFPNSFIPQEDHFIGKNPFIQSKPDILVQSKNSKAEIHSTEKKQELGTFQSIYESYSAFNEAERMQKLEHLTAEQKSYYISENIISYLEEFVANIRIKKLSGVIKDDGSMEMLGTNVTEMYNHSAEMAGSGSREWNEKNGLDLIAQGIQEGNNRAIWVSSPKIGDYGFVFTFLVDEYDEQLKGKPFRELLLRYTEPKDSLATSKELYNKLTDRIGLNAPDSTTFTVPSDFLAHPLTYKLDGFEDVETLYEYLEISPGDVKQSEEFRLQVINVIQPYLTKYTEIIQQMSSFNLDTLTSDFQQLEKNANYFIGAMFNAARIVKRRMDNEATSERLMQDEYQLQQLITSNPDEMIFRAQNMAQYESLIFQGNSNCEVTKQAGLYESSFIANMSNGMSVGAAMEIAGLDITSPSKKEFDGKCVNCPNCKKTVDAIITKKNIKCPKCKFEVKR